jgi:hypothetical protein
MPIAQPQRGQDSHSAHLKSFSTHAKYKPISKPATPIAPQKLDFRKEESAVGLPQAFGQGNAEYSPRGLGISRFNRPPQKHHQNISAN